MTFNDLQPRLVTRAHRCRAAGLGVAASAALGLGAAASARQALSITHALAGHARTTTMDSAPVVLWWALAATLLWAALLCARSVLDLSVDAQRLYDENFRFAVASWPARIAALLLAITAFGSTNTTVALASPTVSSSAIAPTSPAAQQFPLQAPPLANDLNQSAAPSAPEPGWTASRPPGDAAQTTRSAALVAGRAGSSDERTVVVRRGDTLWSIVARHLGPAADARQIARTWPTWFAANRDVIGADPDVLLVGQELRIPDPTHPAAPIPTFDGSSR